MTEQVRDGRSTRWDPHRANDGWPSSTPRSPPSRRTARRPSPARSRRWPACRAPTSTGTSTASRRSTSPSPGTSPRRSVQQIRGGWPTKGSARDIIGGAISEHLGWIEAHPNLYRFLAQHAYAVDATGSPTVDDAKAAFATELTALLVRYMEYFEIDTAPAERVIVGVVGMVDATAAWWLEHRDISRADLTSALTDQVWLIIGTTTRASAWTWIRTPRCPAPEQARPGQAFRRSTRTSPPPSARSAHAPVTAMPCHGPK